MRESSPTKFFPDNISRTRASFDADSHGQSFNFRSSAPIISQDLYYEACVSDPAEALEKATAIGFPVMIKASEGGGGKGIRKASGPDNFHGLFMQVGFHDESMMVNE